MNIAWHCISRDVDLDLSVYNIVSSMCYRVCHFELNLRFWHKLHIQISGECCLVCVFTYWQRLLFSLLHGPEFDILTESES